MFKIINKKDMEEIKVSLKEIYNLAEKQQKTNKEIYTSLIHLNDRINFMEQKFLELSYAIQKIKIAQNFFLWNGKYKDNTIAKEEWNYITRNMTELDNMLKKEIERYKVKDG